MIQLDFIARREPWECNQYPQMMQRWAHIPPNAMDRQHSNDLGAHIRSKEHGQMTQVNRFEASLAKHSLDQQATSSRFDLHLRYFPYILGAVSVWRIRGMPCYDIKLGCEASPCNLTKIELYIEFDSSVL